MQRHDTEWQDGAPAGRARWRSPSHERMCAGQENSSEGVGAPSLQERESRDVSYYRERDAITGRITLQFLCIVLIGPD
jgi:hypothetical protein